jgi:hypothetical protein
MRPETLEAKAYQATAFTAHHRARAFAVPTKLVGVSANQEAVAALAEYADALPNAGLGLPLIVEDHGRNDELTGGPGTLAVSFRPYDRDGVADHPQPLGLVQRKHARWLRALLFAGASLRLTTVTGRGATDPEGRPHTLGVNVFVAHAGQAAQNTRFRHGQMGRPSQADVVLRRTRAGDAEVRFGREGEIVIGPYEWGYHGAGPARLARAVLRRFADEGDAETHALAFKREVIAQVPKRGAVVEAAFVRAWVAARMSN